MTVQDLCCQEYQPHLSVVAKTSTVTLKPGNVLNVCIIYDNTNLIFHVNNYLDLLPKLIKYTIYHYFNWKIISL